MRAVTHAGILVLLFAIAAPAAAQQPPRPPEPPQPPQAGMMQGRFLNVEAALRMKDELKLTAAQQTQLEALRKEIVAQRQEHARERIDVQSRLAAGLITRDEVRKQFEGRRDAMQQTVEQRHERVSKILSQEQQDQLELSTRRHMMQRMHPRRGGRGFGPGMGGGAGRGFGYGRGWF